MATTWDSGHANSFTLSNGNLTATFAGTTGTWTSVRGTTSHSSGKWYFEINVTTYDGNGGCDLGVGNASIANNFCGVDNNSCGWADDGVSVTNFFLNSVTTNSPNDHPFASGMFFGIAVDITNQLIWATIDGSTWNASGSPSAGTGGFGFAALTGALFPAFSSDGEGGVADVGVLNCRTPFHFTVPTGFAPWDPPIGGFDLTSQFPLRSRQDYQMLAALSKQNEQWPFTAVKTPTQKGFDWDPQFPIRTWHRFRDTDEHWPFTATLTPVQMGWEWRPEFARSRWQRMRYEDYTFSPPVTAAVTPTQFGWDNPERLPFRIRPRPLTLQDEEWPFTAVPTPTQFGWDNPERFPLRVRFRPVLSADEQYPFTAAVTPTQFGWQIEPFFPLRPRFRPLVPAEQLLVPIAGTPTPTNIDFAYPPEFYIERRKYQPLSYEFWQPDIPPLSPTFQVMTGLAVKTKARTGATYITVTLQGTGIFMFAQQPTPTIFNEVLPFGSAHVVITSGSMPVSVALGVSNDGVNFTQLGPALSQFPNILNLIASPRLNMNNLAPFKYHAWIVTGGDATTLITITEILVGWRA